METQTVAIYGAQMVAVSVYYAVRELYKQVRVLCFIVKDREGNPDSVDGLPVVMLDQFRDKNVTILIATPEDQHAVIKGDLEKRGLEHCICIDSRREAALMERYYCRIAGFPTLRSYPAGEQKAGAVVYMSKSCCDRPLKGVYSMPGWVCPIQAGASLTDVRVAEVCDNEGENISEKNANYSELSAMYWAGKHGDADYLGLFHYRRVLDIQEEDLYRLLGNGIDAILPYPTVCFPDSGAHISFALSNASDVVVPVNTIIFFCQM